ncbi:MAG: hypothetical protein ABW321_20270 [Polyangiales bacterium]
MFDVGPLSLGVGVGALYGIFWQRFEPSVRSTPGRVSSLGGLLVPLELALQLGAFFGILQIEPTSYFFSVRDHDGHEQLETAFALRAGLALGHRF